MATLSITIITGSGGPFQRTWYRVVYPALVCCRIMEGGAFAGSDCFYCIIIGQGDFSFALNRDAYVHKEQSIAASSLI